MRVLRRRSGTAVATALLLVVPLLVLGTPGPAGAQRQSAVGAAVAAAERPVGLWSVTRVGPQTYRVAWRSPQRLRVGSDRPEITRAGAALGISRVGRDGRTVYVDVPADRRPDPSTLDVVLSGDRLDVSGDDVSARTAGRGTGRSSGSLAARAVTTLPDDPATPGSFGVERSEYELDPVKIPGMAQPIEMVGHVVEPVAGAVTGPRPVVLFLHGRHSFCYHPTKNRDSWNWPCRAPFKEVPSHLGYDYVQEVLASQGYFTVSVRVNGINAQDGLLNDGGADARAQIVERHLDHWTTHAAEHQLDLSQVVLVGHSRGGEGVDRAALEIPLSAPYTIAGQVLLAPTDFAAQTAAYVPTVTVLPYCDGDVFDLQGQLFTDAARDLTTDDTSLKSSVLVLGANHNFFNTEWTPGLSQAPSWDDWGDEGDGLCGTAHPDRLSPTGQQSVGSAYVAGAVHLFTRDEQQYLPLFDGSAAAVASTGDAEVLSHAIGGGRELRRPGLDSGLSLADGAQTQLCVGAYPWERSQHALCGRFGDVYGNAPHWSMDGDFLAKRQNLEVRWTAPGQTGGLTFDDPLDVSGPRRLELRTIVDPTLGDAAFTVRLTDADGDHADVVPEGGSELPALPFNGWLGKRWGQTVIVDPAAAAGVDTSRIVRVDLVGESARGRVWVLDVASATDQLAAVPQKRLAVISLGRAKVLEGHRRAATALVPFTVSGSLTRRATVAVGVLTDSGDPRILNLDLAPGQTSGSVVVDYAGDRRDGRNRELTMLAGFPRTGVMTDQYLGRLVVVDDDPTPRVRIGVRQPKVREGTPATWQVRLAKPVDYEVWVTARPVARGGGPLLSTDDLPAGWLRRRGLSPSDATPLHQTKVELYTRIRPGRTTATLPLPTRPDGVKEGRETVSMRVVVRMPGGRVRAVRTVAVVDR